MSKKGDEIAMELIRLRDDEGLKQYEAAARLGLSPTSASNYLKRFQGRTAKAMTLSAPVGEMLRKQMDEMGEVVRLADEARELMELIKSVLKGEGNEYYELKSKLKRICDGSADKFLISLMAEVRKQVELHFSMREKYCNMERVVEFQKTVMEEIQRESPEVAQRIVTRLVQARTLRDSIDLGMPSQGAK
jgi:predicted transcriptional regulator